MADYLALIDPATGYCDGCPDCGHRHDCWVCINADDKSRCVTAVERANRDGHTDDARSTDDDTIGPDIADRVEGSVTSPVTGRVTRHPAKQV